MVVCVQSSKFKIQKARNQWLTQTVSSDLKFIQKMQSLCPDYYYLRFKITPPTKDVLMIRKTISDCLVQSFGSTVVSMYLDVLWIDDSDHDDDGPGDGDGKECVIRTHTMWLLSIFLNKLFSLGLITYILAILLGLLHV